MHKGHRDTQTDRIRHPANSNPAIQSDPCRAARVTEKGGYGIPTPPRETEGRGCLLSGWEVAGWFTEKQNLGAIKSNSTEPLTKYPSATHAVTLMTQRHREGHLQAFQAAPTPTNGPLITSGNGTQIQRSNQSAAWGSCSGSPAPQTR